MTDATKALFPNVDQGQPDDACDTPTDESPKPRGMTFEEGMRARVEAQRSWSTAQSDFEARMRARSQT